MAASGLFGVLGATGVRALGGLLGVLGRPGEPADGAAREEGEGVHSKDLPWALSATSTEEGPLRSHPAGDDSELGGEQQSPGEWVSPGSSPRSAGPSPDRRRRRAQALPRVGAGRGEEAHGDDLDDSHTPRLSGSPSTRPFTPPREGALTAALSTSQAAPSAPAARQLRGRSECWSPGPGPEAPASADMAAQRPTECRSSGPLTPRGGPDRAGPETQALTHDQAEAAAEAAMQFTLSQLSRSDSVPEWVPRFTQGGSPGRKVPGRPIPDRPRSDADPASSVPGTEALAGPGSDAGTLGTSGRGAPGSVVHLRRGSADRNARAPSLQQLVEMDLFVEHGGGQVPASARQAGMARSDKGAKSWAASRQSPAPTPIRLGKQPSLTDEQLDRMAAADFVGDLACLAQRLEEVAAAGATPPGQSPPSARPRSAWQTPPHTPAPLSARSHGGTAGPPPHASQARRSARSRLSSRSGSRSPGPRPPDVAATVPAGSAPRAPRVSGPGVRRADI